MKDYILGESDEHIKIDSVIENREYNLALAQQARLSIDIFTQTMDKELYDNNDFEQAVFNLARLHRKTKVRILTQDSQHAVQTGHRLIRLMQTLSSTVSIHTPARQHKNEKGSFLIADNIGLIQRIHASDRNFHASVYFNSPQVAGKLSDMFNEMWEHSSPDSSVRRLYV